MVVIFGLVRDIVLDNDGFVRVDFAWVLEQQDTPRHPALGNARVPHDELLNIRFPNYHTPFVIESSQHGTWVRFGEIHLLYVEHQSNLAHDNLRQLLDNISAQVA